MKELRAFTVKPLWAFLIMQGYKDVENRNIAPVPAKGTAAVHVSSSFTKAEYDAVMANYPPDTRAQLPYELLHDLCGKIIGLVDYEVVAKTESQWWDKSGKPIMLSNPRWLSEPFVPCKGALQFWHVPEDLIEQVYAMVMPA